MTLPPLMQEVQTFIRLVFEPARLRTVWMLGLKRRLVRRLECEMLLPKPGPLPHTSHTEATEGGGVIAITGRRGRLASEGQALQTGAAAKQ